MTREVRTRLVTVGVISLIFSLGVLAGVAADRTFGDALTLFAAPPQEAEAPIPDEQAGEAEGNRSRWIIHQVDLSEDQRVFVDSVVSYYRAEVRALSKRYDEAYWEAVQATRDALRAVLDVQQREQYDALLEARDRSRNRGERDEDR
jgi:Spy/CpxP family protein refolding chaperone